VTELVIDAPHLQTNRQRFGAATLTLFGWLLWCYFLFPLVSLGCWLWNDELCSQWVNMAGGYLNLREMLTFYLHAVAVIAGAWCLWLACSVCRGLLRRHPAPVAAVAAASPCRGFGVDPGELEACQASRFVTVHFDRHGAIVGLERSE
jgi:poly-beta-1,6-N-acetyl-D-glucosamine biosynthesis protein PgaD